MKRFLLGLFSVGAIVLSPVAVQAQSYDLFEAGDCGGLTVNFICHDQSDSGVPMLYAIPSGYSGRYVLYAIKIPDGILTFAYDVRNEQAVAYMFLGGNNTGRPNAGGSIVLLDELEEEIVDIATQLSLY